MRYPLRNRIEVEWRDSHSHQGWDTTEGHRGNASVGPMRSIGYVLAKDRHIIQLAQSMSAITGHVADTITIPRENVIRMRRIPDWK